MGGGSCFSGLIVMATIAGPDPRAGAAGSRLARRRGCADGTAEGDYEDDLGLSLTSPGAGPAAGQVPHLSYLSPSPLRTCGLHMTRMTLQASPKLSDVLVSPEAPRLTQDEALLGGSCPRLPASKAAPCRWAACRLEGQALGRGRTRVNLPSGSARGMAARAGRRPVQPRFRGLTVLCSEQCGRRAGRLRPMFVN